MRERSKAISESLDYLRDGGLSETLGMADAAWNLGEKKVQMDTSMALALCILAGDGLLAEMLLPHTKPS